MLANQSLSYIDAQTDIFGDDSTKGSPETPSSTVSSLASSSTSSSSSSVAVAPASTFSTETRTSTPVTSTTVPAPSATQTGTGCSGSKRRPSVKSRRDLQRAAILRREE